MPERDYVVPTDIIGENLRLASIYRYVRREPWVCYYLVTSRPADVCFLVSGRLSCLGPCSDGLALGDLHG